MTTKLKLGWDLGPGAVCDAVGACKFVDVLVVGGICVSNVIEGCLIFGSHNLMKDKIYW